METTPTAASTTTTPAHANSEVTPTATTSSRHPSPPPPTTAAAATTTTTTTSSSTSTTPGATTSSSTSLSISNTNTAAAPSRVSSPPPPLPSKPLPPNVSTTTPPTSTTTTTYAKGRKERPCDACRRRKSRCVMNAPPDAPANSADQKCVLCQFHSQECTFVQSPQPRKRRLASAASSGTTTEKKRTTTATAPNSPQQQSAPIRQSAPVTDYASLPHSSLRSSLGLQGARHSRHIGPTSEYEPALIDLCPFDNSDEYALPSSTGGVSFRRLSPTTTFLLSPDAAAPAAADSSAIDEVERIVAPHGPKLVRLYFRIVHPSFPILHRRVFLEKYGRTHREFCVPLLAAVYLLALHWWGYDRDLAPLSKPSVSALEALAAQGMHDVVAAPKLSGVQAGLLLLQRTSGIAILGSPWALTSQLVAIGQELGLHLDCSAWAIPGWEKGLRRRLAWALYMQDKWGALTGGRPSHIGRRDWAVRPVTPSDFPADCATDGASEAEEVEKGRQLFTQLISLTVIMADVLETFFTVAAAGGGGAGMGTGKVLERAKPIQLRLKNWFTTLPECLRMDAPNKARRLSSTGYLHLAYFATEITLHRCILRTLSPASLSPSHASHASSHLSHPAPTDPYLLHICRSAAKTRLISAMDFVNRLKPEHLASFWYFASKVNFALIGTFGSLLWATSPSTQEAEFYKARLSEYRWTLRVSSRGAEFMEFAVGVLDTSAGYLQQEAFRKRGLGGAHSNSNPNSGTGGGAGGGGGGGVGNGGGSGGAGGAGGSGGATTGWENFGLGMGAGLNIDVSAPVPPPPPGFLSPVSAHSGAMGGDPGEGSDDDEGDGDGDEEMGEGEMGYSDDEGDGDGGYGGSEDGSEGSGGSDDGDEGGGRGGEGRGGAGGGRGGGDGREQDFFMIPNSAPHYGSASSADL
ncbi:fungal-specific transcription factor domain-containing protein [Geopyxis carbonaria]|nr:fungal-specific transcription factor domain-containing protein [Geopyxis carbonaria]